MMSSASISGLGHLLDAARLADRFVQAEALLKEWGATDAGHFLNDDKCATELEEHLKLKVLEKRRFRTALATLIAAQDEAKAEAPVNAPAAESAEPWNVVLAFLDARNYPVLWTTPQGAILGMSRGMRAHIESTWGIGQRAKALFHGAPVERLFGTKRNPCIEGKASLRSAVEQRTRWQEMTLWVQCEPDGEANVTMDAAALGSRIEQTFAESGQLKLEYDHLGQERMRLMVVSYSASPECSLAVGAPRESTFVVIQSLDRRLGINEKLATGAMSQADAINLLGLAESSDVLCKHVTAFLSRLERELPKTQSGPAEIVRSFVYSSEKEGPKIPSSQPSESTDDSNKSSGSDDSPREGKEANSSETDSEDGKLLAIMQSLSAFAQQTSFCIGDSCGEGFPLVAVSSAFQRLFMHSQGLILGKRCGDVLGATVMNPPWLMTKIVDACGAVAAGVKTHDLFLVRDRRGNGECLSVHVQVMMLSSLGQLPLRAGEDYMIGLQTDVTTFVGTEFHTEFLYDDCLLRCETLNPSKAIENASEVAHELLSFVRHVAGQRARAQLISRSKSPNKTKHKLRSSSSGSSNNTDSNSGPKAPTGSTLVNDQCTDSDLGTDVAAPVRCGRGGGYKIGPADIIHSDSSGDQHV
jgi:hypothetical protein